MEDRETPRMHKCGESKTTRNMMATVRHVTSISPMDFCSTECTWYFYPQERLRNSLHFKIKSLHITLLLSELINWFINCKNMSGMNNIQFKKSALTTSLCVEPPAHACRISLTAFDHQASNFPGAAEANELNKYSSPPPPAFVSSIGDGVTFLHSYILEAGRLVGLDTNRLLQAVSQRPGLTYRPSFHSVFCDG